MPMFSAYKEMSKKLLLPFPLPFCIISRKRVSGRTSVLPVSDFLCLAAWLLGFMSFRDRLTWSCCKDYEFGTPVSTVAPFWPCLPSPHVRAIPMTSLALCQSPYNGCWRLLLLPIAGSQRAGELWEQHQLCLAFSAWLLAVEVEEDHTQDHMCSNTSSGSSIEYSQGLLLGLKAELYSSSRVPPLFSPTSLHLCVPHLYLTWSEGPLPSVRSCLWLQKLFADH